jgi:DNA (cytosine-5)-methyltransferase 1
MKDLTIQIRSVEILSFDKLRRTATLRMTVERSQRPSSPQMIPSLRFIDLFAGIGGFRIAAESLGWRCVFSSEIDSHCQDTYEANFGDRPAGDIRQVDAAAVPDHDILLGGFPCQPFSIIGKMHGLSDTRGTLFFEIERILEAKRPRWLVLENVKQLLSNDGGRTIETIMRSLREMGYQPQYRVLNALNFGLPQKRERIVIVANNAGIPFEWPAGGVPMRPLSEILERNVPESYFASPEIRAKRLADHTPEVSPAIWHENKAGHISSYPFSCALRAGASYNYLLVDGVRRLTGREMLRLQGFPDSFKITGAYTQTRKQAGNAVPVPMVRAALAQVAASEAKMAAAAAQPALA